jgi:hypothetical protein
MELPSHWDYVRIKRMVGVPARWRLGADTPVD